MQLKKCSREAVAAGLQEDMAKGGHSETELLQQWLVWPVISNKETLNRHGIILPYNAAKFYLVLGPLQPYTPVRQETRKKEKMNTNTEAIALQM